MDSLRAVAVVAVIVEHAVNLTPGSVPAALQAVTNAVAPFRIPTLVFLSGMLLSRSLARPRREYVQGKLSRIAWPYLVWSVITVGVSSLGQDRPDLLEEVVAPTSPMWFLAYLLAFYALALVVPAAVRGWLVVPALLASALADPAGLHSFFVHSPEHGVQRFFLTLAFFFAGDLLARHADRVLPVLLRREVVAVAAVLALGAAAISAAGWTVRYQPLYAVAVFAGIVALIPLFERFAATRAGAVVGGYGRHTMELYVVHWPVQLVTWHVVVALGPDGGLVVTCANALAGLGAGLALVHLQRRVPVLRRLFDLTPR